MVRRCVQNLSKLDCLHPMPSVQRLAHEIKIKTTYHHMANRAKRRSRLDSSQKNVRMTPPMSLCCGSSKKLVVVENLGSSRCNRIATTRGYDEKTGFS